MDALRAGLVGPMQCEILFLTFCFRECRLLISTKCAGMGCDVPDTRLTVCIGEMGGIYKDIDKFKWGSLKTPGSCPRCWEEVAVMATMLHL